MSSSHNRVVVITYAADTKDFVANPDPVSMEQGNHRLYFALQTVLGQDGVEASFESIESSDGQDKALPLDSTPQLSVVEVHNDNPGPGEQPVPYSVKIRFNGAVIPKDPTVILKPPGPGLPSRARRDR